MTEERVRLNALLIEDDDAQSKLQAALLSSAGFDVTACRDGSSGIRSFRDNEYHLVVVDICLPDLPGHEVISLIRGSSIGRRIAVIVITSQSDESVMEEAMHSGADDIYQKNIGSHVLRAKYQSLAERIAVDVRTQTRIESLERKISKTLESIATCASDKDDKINVLTNRFEETFAKPPILTDEQISKIAEQAAAKAIANMTTDLYKTVGKGVINKVSFVVGIAVVYLAVFLTQKGWIKL